MCSSLGAISSGNDRKKVFDLWMPKNHKCDKLEEFAVCDSGTTGV